ncbi:hypothetical protein B0T10DRAFT_461457 [Thelonectria olida]|uniref:Uncharacterized protein n=1 Tax=Thelonectria olida TaxID=1576542 RepID=A0A9P8W3V1_9HYPO|nr:hypothetical protein B0T10DRAFT_461457 [Thelonectria olida]
MASFGIPAGFHMLVRLLLFFGAFASRSQAGPIWYGGILGNPNPITGLVVTLMDISATPFTFKIIVKNHNLVPVTYLNWGSPLDPFAFDLGLLKVTKKHELKPLDLVKLIVNDVNPDPKSMIDPNSLIEIDPGQTHEQDIVIGQYQLVWAAKKTGVELEKLVGKASAQLKGRWLRVWPKERKVVIQDLEAGAGRNGSFTGEFASNVIELEART